MDKEALKEIAKEIEFLEEERVSTVNAMTEIDKQYDHYKGYLDEISKKLTFLKGVIKEYAGDRK